MVERIDNVNSLLKVYLPGEKDSYIILNMCLFEGVYVDGGKRRNKKQYVSNYMHNRFKLKYPRLSKVFNLWRYEKPHESDYTNICVSVYYCSVIADNEVYKLTCTNKDEAQKLLDHIYSQLPIIDAEVKKDEE